MVLCLAIKCNRKWFGEMIHYWGVCLLEQPLCILQPYFPGSVWTLSADWKWSMCLLCFCFASAHNLGLPFFLYFFLSLPLSWPMSFFILFSPGVLLRSGDERAAGCAFGIQGKLSPPHQPRYVWSQMTECGFLSYSQMSDWKKSVFRKTTYSSLKIKTNLWGREYFHHVFSGAGLSL